MLLCLFVIASWQQCSSLIGMFCRHVLHTDELENCFYNVSARSMCCRNSASLGTLHVRPAGQQRPHKQRVHLYQVLPPGLPQEQPIATPNLKT